jgi:ectoine hydroxylase-related dioxygenase (phytanoyl-CoA dioxygenase family)
VTTTSELPRFAADVGIDEVADAVRTSGAAIVERLAPPELCDRVERELRPWIDDTPFGADAFSGPATRRTGALLARSEAVRDLVAHPLVLGVTDQVLWPSKTTYQLHLTQAISLDPGAEAQALHRDQWCFDFFPFPDDVEVELATMWALTDFTADNGATRVVPGSNQLTLEGIDLSELNDAAVSAVMPRGSVVLYSGRTVHGGGRNATDHTRIGVNIDYVLGWLRQEENQYLVTPPEVARHLPEPLQRLVGYTFGAYALGYAHELRDPVEVLRDGDDHGRQAPTFAPKV